ncbi:TetR/AcrR family transcriptional regulator [bacterium]|nr:TetR/AcrR family transcriptional regulator [bacterium]
MAEIAANTRDRIIEEAEYLIQTRGYDSFSFAHLEERIGIRKASIHHHFPSKTDLGLEIVKRFRANCQGAFDQLDRECSDPIDRLKAYAGLFIQAIENGGRMCLCGILAAGFSTLPTPLLKQLRSAALEHENWLSKTFQEGLETKRIQPRGDADSLAQRFFSSLEGAMLLSRMNGGSKKFKVLVAELLGDLPAAPPRRPKSKA